MMYLFHGSDVAKVRFKAFAWVAATRAKAPDAVYTRLTVDTLTPHTLAEAMSAQGLFFTRSLTLLDDPFSEDESGELVLKELKALAASENPIALLAPKLSATVLKKIEPHAAKVFVEQITQKKVVRGFNSGLVNALAAKDATGLWKEIIKAERQGDAPEMIHGLLHWKVRDLMQKGDRTWTKEGARALSVELIQLVSSSRGGDLSLKETLERFALSLSKT